MKIPHGFNTITPYLTVADAGEYIEFLKNAFGAIEIGRSLREGGRIANCQVRIGDSMLMIGNTPDDYKHTHISLYLFVENAHEAMERAIAAGAKNIMEVAEKPYGDLQGGVEDIRGNLWWISQRLVDGGYFD